MTKNTEQKKTRTTASGLLSKIDRFGEGVNFQIKGRDTFKTPIGALITIIVVSFIMYYGA